MKHLLLILLLLPAIAFSQVKFKSNILVGDSGEWERVDSEIILAAKWLAVIIDLPEGKDTAVFAITSYERKEKDHLKLIVHTGEKPGEIHFIRSNGQMRMVVYIEDKKFTFIIITENKVANG
jgi:hypothetical protein